MTSNTARPLSSDDRSEREDKAERTEKREQHREEDRRNSLSSVGSAERSSSQAERNFDGMDDVYKKDSSVKSGIKNAADEKAGSSQELSGQNKELRSGSAMEEERSTDSVGSHSSSSGQNQSSRNR